MGFIYKSLLMLESGIKPVWVFDGLPPEQKRKELARRRKIKMEAKSQEEEAKEMGQLDEQQSAKQQISRAWDPRDNENERGCDAAAAANGLSSDGGQGGG